MNKEKILNNIEENIAMENFRAKDKKNKKMKKILQTTFTIGICTLSVGGIVFAKDISIKIYENVFLTGEGVKTAINEGYIEKPEMEYEEANGNVEDNETGKVIEDVDTKIRVKEMLMDDFNLSLTFDVELSEKIKEIVKADEVWEINFPDLIVYDENNTVLLCPTGIKYEEFSKKHNLGLNYDKALETNKYIGSGLNIVPIKKQGNNIEVVYNIYTGGDSIYPKSKKLKFELSKIKISKKETVMGNEEITLSGNWNFEIDVPEKMYNRTQISYMQKKTSNKEFKVISAIAYDTGFDIKAEIKTDIPSKYPESLEYKFYSTIKNEDKYLMPDILAYISWKERQTPEYVEYTEKRNNLYNLKVYIEDKNKNRYDLTSGPRENGSMKVNENGILEYLATFDLTKYNLTDEITVCFEYKGKTEKVILEKKGEV